MAKDTILYVCPYCIKGRFTASDGWDGATRHIRENHSPGDTRHGHRVGNRGRNRNKSRLDPVDPLEEKTGEDEVEEEE